MLDESAEKMEVVVDYSSSLLLVLSLSLAKLYVEIANNKMANRTLSLPSSSLEVSCIALRRGSSTDGPTTKGPAMTEPTDKSRQARLA